jgi:hypothetical protein
MAQLRRGVTHILEAQVHLLAVAIPKFILIEKPLPPLHAMAQSRHGGSHILEAKTHPMYLLAKAIPLGALGAFLPPYFKSPHVSIKPLVLRIAKAAEFE